MWRWFAILPINMTLDRNVVHVYSLFYLELEIILTRITTISSLPIMYNTNISGKYSANYLLSCIYNTFPTTVTGWITIRDALYDLPALSSTGKSNKVPSKTGYRMAPATSQVHLPLPQESLFNNTYFMTQSLYKYCTTNEYFVFWNTRQSEQLNIIPPLNVLYKKVCCPAA